ncbi:enoyl-ACP reductase [Cloacibacterium normanense]|uniref:enoyl-ACP reductase FabI n=1 Tax=Cloacibacterium normanense TaxID=237258 RepID=UPI00391A6E09
MFTNQTFLITGIADENSLAMYVAKKIIKNNGNVVCTGLGVTPFHKNLSEKAESFLNKSYNDFENACKKLLGENVLTFPLDITLPESLEALTDFLNEKNVKLNGFLHAIAMDKTIRQKSVKPMLEVTADEFNDTMTVSAFSLISLSHALLKSKVLQNGASIVTLSYIAAEKVSFFPYINMSIAKAALERLTIEMAYELGRDFGIRANCVRFSPYMGSKAGNATLKIEDVERANTISPLGNANPEDLAHEVVHLFRKDIRITGEIRHVDGGFHIMG